MIQIGERKKERKRDGERREGGETGRHTDRKTQDCIKKNKTRKAILWFSQIVSVTFTAPLDRMSGIR